MGSTHPVEHDYFNNNENCSHNDDDDDYDNEKDNVNDNERHLQHHCHVPCSCLVRSLVCHTNQPAAHNYYIPHSQYSLYMQRLPTSS